MEKRRMTLEERLNSIPADEMEVGEIYHIIDVSKVIEFTDQRSGEIRKAVIVECEEGNYFLPNTIAEIYLEDPEHNRSVIAGKTVKVRKFRSKTYNTEGKTLNYYNEKTKQEA